MAVSIVCYVLMIRCTRVIIMHLIRATNRRIGAQRHGITALDFFTRYYIQLLLAVATVLLAAANPYFRTVANAENILLQASFAAIGAAGMTLLIVSGAFDLSVAGLLGLSGVMTAELLPSLGVVLTILASLILGVLLGFLNGLVV